MAELRCRDGRDCWTASHQALKILIPNPLNPQPQEPTHSTPQVGCGFRVRGPMTSLNYI